MGLEIVAHPSERGAPRRSVTVACGCSCCCCCLHTLGGLAGGAVGSALAARKSGDGQGRGPTIGIYWLAVVLVSAAVPPIFGGSDGHDVGEFIEIAGLALALTLPFVQLAASLVTLVVIAVAPVTVFPVKREALRALGSVTLFAFLGAVAGTLSMVGLAGALGALT